MLLALAIAEADSLLEALDSACAAADEALRVSEAPAKRPLHPYARAGLAILLPGVGHVAIGQAQRGLVFAFFTLFFGLLTYLMLDPGAVLHRPACGRLLRLGLVDPGCLSARAHQPAAAGIRTAIVRQERRILRRHPDCMRYLASSLSAKNFSHQDDHRYRAKTKSDDSTVSKRNSAAASHESGASGIADPGCSRLEERA